jgi:Putative DNA-binding domain
MSTEAMPKPKQYSSISQRSRELLKSGETREVDYKENARGLHAEDLVAFANSPSGGAILLGVEEFTNAEGTQQGRPVGCQVDDDARLQVLSKALSCSPAVEIELFTENLSRQAFFRVEIPSGAHKPYATSAGTYKIREDSRNNPLLPEALLKMFLDREGSEFRERFAEATGALHGRMQDALSAVGNLEDEVSKKIEEIGSSMGWAEYKAGDAADTIETVQSLVTRLAHEVADQTKRLRAIAAITGAKDPVKEAAELEVLEFLKKKLSVDPKLLKAAKSGKALSVSLQGRLTAELTKDDLTRLVREAMSQLSNPPKQ